LRAPTALLPCPQQEARLTAGRSSEEADLVVQYRESHGEIIFGGLCHACGALLVAHCVEGAAPGSMESHDVVPELKVSDDRSGFGPSNRG